MTRKWSPYVAAVAITLGFGSASFGQGTVYIFEEETIQGTIEKPEAFYILSPSSLQYQSGAVEESFLDRLYETAEEEPL